MATLYGPKINTSNLVLALDVASSNSYVSGSTSWVDLSGNANNGLVFNSPRYLTSNNGNILFTSGSYVQISSSATLSDLTVGSNITIMGWVNRCAGSSSWLPIITKASSSGADNINYELAYTGTGSITSSMNAYCFSYRNSANTAFHGFSTEGGYEDDVWHHVAFTYTMATGSTARFYVDGEFVTGSWTNGNGNEAPLNTNNGPVYIAKTNVANEFFTGSIGALQVYNKLLTQAEVTANYDATKTRYGHPLPWPTVYAANGFCCSNAMVYNFTASRELSNAYFLYIPQNSLWFFTPWTASLTGSNNYSLNISRSLAGYVNLAGQRPDVLALPLGNLPAGNYRGQVLPPQGTYNNSDDTAHILVLENVKQFNSERSLTFAPNWTYNFGGSTTQSSSYGDMIVGYTTRQNASPSDMTGLENIAHQNPRSGWGSTSRYAWNRVRGSRTYSRVSSNGGGNGQIFTIGLRRRQ
jgi:hypothetical protein